MSNALYEKLMSRMKPLTREEARDARQRRADACGVGAGPTTAAGAQMVDVATASDVVTPDDQSFVVTFPRRKKLRSAGG